MKNICSLFLLTLTLLAATTAPAAILGAPYSPEIDTRFDKIERGTQVAGVQGSFNQTVAKAIFNMTGLAVGTYTLPVTLPKGAIIGQAWIEVAAVPAPAGTTVAFQCVGANDVFTATDETAATIGNIVTGAETGPASTMLYVPAGCTLKAVIAVHTATAGIINLFVEYVVAN